MATRALITIETGNKNQKTPLLKIYKHWDGYPEWLGTLIYSFLSKVQLNSGMVESNENTIMCNGYDEFAAKLLTYLKGLSPDGDVYLADLDSSGSDVDAAYVYTISLYSESSYNNRANYTIDEIKVNSLIGDRNRQIFKHAKGGQDEIISEFGAFLNKEQSKSTPVSEVLRTQALCDTVTTEMVVRNITQVLLAEVMNNESLVKFELRTSNSPLYNNRQKEADGFIKIPVITDELAHAAVEITPNNIVSEVEIGVSLIETAVDSGEYRVKSVSRISALCRTSDPLSKATYSHLLRTIKLNTSDVYPAFLKPDGSGKDLVLKVRTSEEVVQAKFATSNPATVKQTKQDEMALF